MQRGERRDTGKLVLAEVQPYPLRKFARSAEGIGADPLHAFLMGFEWALAVKSPHEVVALPIVRPVVEKEHDQDISGDNRCRHRGRTQATHQRLARTECGLFSNGLSSKSLVACQVAHREIPAPGVAADQPVLYLTGSGDAADTEDGHRLQISLPYWYQSITTSWNFGGMNRHSVGFDHG